MNSKDAMERDNALRAIIAAPIGQLSLGREVTVFRNVIRDQDTHIEPVFFAKATIDPEIPMSILVTSRWLCFHSLPPNQVKRTGPVDWEPALDRS